MLAAFLALPPPLLSSPQCSPLLPWAAPALRPPATRSRSTVRCAASGDPQSLDRLIMQLRESTPQQMPQILAANMKNIDQRLFLRLAEMSDAEEDEFERLRIRQLATAVTSSLEQLIAKADAQLNVDATAVQTLLRVMALPNGEFEVPVPEERMQAVRAEIRAQLSTLDEGFVGTTKAYMQKASDDSLEGMVEVLRELLQAFAAERLAALVDGRVDETVRGPLLALLKASPRAWDDEMRKQLTSADASCGADELLACLQDQMGEVVLGMPAGSAVQTVLAEYLSELLTRARTIAAEEA